MSEAVATNEPRIVPSARRPVQAPPRALRPAPAIERERRRAETARRVRAARAAFARMHRSP